MKKLIALLLILGLFLNGCSSLVNTFVHGTHPYIGTRTSVSAIVDPIKQGEPSLGWFILSLLVVADLGPTIAMDTLLLPITLTCDSGGFSADGCP